MPLRSLIGKVLKRKGRSKKTTMPGAVDDNAIKRERERKKKQRKQLEQLSSKVGL
jgi:hypothetical protein